jgi:hypothetical protein
MKTENLVLLAGGGLALWYFLTQNQTAAAAAPSSSPAPAPAPTTTPATPVTIAPPPYTGPSLASMYSQLLAAEQAAYGTDPAITCQFAAPVPAVGTPIGVSTSRQNTLLSQNAVANASQRGPITGTQSALSGLGASCPMPTAVTSVHNWYLAHRTNSGIVNGPAIPGDTGQPMTLSDYWAAVSPILVNQTPGLSGIQAIRSRMYGGWA